MHQPNGGRGFSLTELLVVVAIIAVISALVLPTIQAVREAARGVVCSGNMRNLGMYMLSYAADRKGALPPAHQRWWLPWNGNADYTQGKSVHDDVWGDPWNFWTYYVARMQFDAEGGTDTQWWTARWPWMKEAGNLRYFQCPSAPVQFAYLSDPPPGGYTWKHELLSSSYGMNSAYLGDTSAAYLRGKGSGDPPTVEAYIADRPWLGMHATKGRSGWPGYGIGGGAMHDAGRRLNGIPKHSSTIMLAEHQGSRSSGFTTITDPPFVQDPIDAQGNPLIASGSRAAPFDTDWTDRSLAVRASHRNRANFLFIDGHISALRPWDTCGTDWMQPNMWTGR